MTTSKDRRRALVFVYKNVRRLYGGTPPPSQILFMAEHAGRICGTIALDFAGPGKEFPIESIYKIDYEKTPWPFNREHIAQFSKWWTTRPRVAVSLMHAAHVYALEKGKQLGLVEAKPRIIAHVGEFGMSLVKVSESKLNEQVEFRRGEGYYTSLPPPELYMFDIYANAAALCRYIKQ